MTFQKIMIQNSTTNERNNNVLDYGCWPGTNLKTVCVENTDDTENKQGWIFHKNYDLLQISKSIVNKYEVKINENRHNISTINKNVFLEDYLISEISTSENFVDLFDTMIHFYSMQYNNKPSNYFDQFSLHNKTISIEPGKVTIKKTNIEPMEKNYKWLKFNSNNSLYKGNWVALKNGELIDYSKSFKLLREKLKGQNQKTILVTKIL